MRDSARALLAGIVDYAGLFPPAKLPLAVAVQNYLRYRAEAESWMLGRFVCPASSLEEMGFLLEKHASDRSVVPIAALGRGGGTTDELVAGLRNDLDLIKAFGQRFGDRAQVSTYEARVPADLLRADATESDQMTAMWQALARAAEIFDAAAKGLSIFCELPLDGDWRKSLAALTSVLHDFAMSRQLGLSERPRLHSAGIKIRCGAASAREVPTSEQLAATLVSCYPRNIPVKATAGLHHPMRHFALDLGASMHGFLNLFGGAVIARSLGLDETKTREIIEEQNAGTFVFADDGLHWRDYFVTVVQITEARDKFITSLGSCSFDEPRQDLKALGLLP